LENTIEENMAAKYLTEQETTLQSSHFVDWVEPDKCCLNTVDSHAEINPIMVCGECRHIIKCFHDERAYKNFLAFCHSRGRNVRAAKYDDLYVVVYKSHGNV
jgi:hypothetical protein